MANIGNEKVRKLKATIWGNMRKCYGLGDYLPGSSPDNQYVLVRAESDWYWLPVLVTSRKKELILYQLRSTENSL